MTGGRIIVVTFLGLLVLAFCYIILSSFGHGNSVLTPILVVLLGAAGLWRQKLQLDTKWQPVLVLAGMLVLLPTALQGGMMAGGDYPKVFFNVDSAFYLQFVHSFLDSGEYPPPRLDNYGLPGHGYHYGVMALAALMTHFTGIAPHTTFLLFVPLIGSAALAAAVNELLKTFDIISPKQRAVILFVLLSGYMQFRYPGPECGRLLSFDGFGCFLEQMLQSAAPHLNTMHFGTLYGISLCFIVVLLTLNNIHRRRAPGYIIAVSLMPVIKTPYIGFIGLGVGGYSLFEFIKTRDYRDLLVPVLGGVVLLANLLLFGASRAAPAETPSFEFLGTINTRDFNTALFYGTIGLSLLIVSNTWSSVSSTWKQSLWFFLPLLLFGVVISIDARNAHQLFSVLPLFAYMYLLLVSIRGIECQRRIGRLTSGVVLLLLTATGAVGLGKSIGTLIFVPENGYEYVDNGPIAEVLSQVPVNGTLLVTNDLRYPANDYARDNRQFQLSALYGHKAFNAEMVYSKMLQTSTEGSRRLYEDKQQARRVFKQDTWDAETTAELVSRYPITHFLVHRSYPHPDAIPLRVVARNSEYKVYAFK